ncbi:(d)CMP kinase [Gangjinia marincola]|uniref:Cytidylate kinase n=1 Tax=Gangjinia marincola TaxID=578463 RepID=A0ABN1MJI1_9FLAO
MSKKITIAIDGYSSTGKSTVAKQLAQKLNYIYVDTGAMYRAVTLYALQHGFIAEGKVVRDKLITALSNIQLDFQHEEDKPVAQIYLNGRNVEGLIRSLEVSGFVSEVAAISEVRKKLVEQQQKMGNGKGIVMDGRDIGTVVFPDAELKIFMTASAEERATRRFKELQEKGDSATYEEVLHNVQHRDHIDTTRKDSPLRKAEGAIEIDNSALTLSGQFNTIYQLAMDRIVGRV